MAQNATSDIDRQTFWSRLQSELWYWLARRKQQSIESNISWRESIFWAWNEVAEASDAFAATEILLNFAFACEIDYVSEWIHRVSDQRRAPFDFHVRTDFIRFFIPAIPFHGNFGNNFPRRLPENWRVLQDIASVAQKAILRETGTKFRTGSVASVLKHTASGGSSDYAYNVAKVPFVITMEVSGDTFHPATKSIEGITRECWIGIRAMCEFLGKQQSVEISRK